MSCTPTAQTGFRTHNRVFLIKKCFISHTHKKKKLRYDVKRYFFVKPSNKLDTSGNENLLSGIIRLTAVCRKTSFHCLWNNKVILTYLVIIRAYSPVNENLVYHPLIVSRECIKRCVISQTATTKFDNTCK